MKKKIKISVWLAVGLLVMSASIALIFLKDYKKTLPPIAEVVEKEMYDLQNGDNALEEEVASVAPSITLVMAGDMLLHTRVLESGRMEDGSYEYNHLFTHVKETIQAADIAIVNQEVILGGIELGLSGYPSFNAPHEVGDALVDAGFDVVLHATNHTLDKGKKGVLNTLDFWQSKYPDIAILGIQDSLEKQNETIYVYEQEGIRIAILNYTYGMNGIPLPRDMPFIVNMLNQDKMIQDIALAKEKADFVIVAPHWGTEYVFEASGEQIEWARFLAEQGVDLVIGTHPHVIEPVQWIESSTGHKMLVYYSIGNFVNATSGVGKGVGARMVGALAKVTLTKDERDRVIIQSYGVEPLVTHIEEGTGKITTYKLSDYTESLAANNHIKSQDASFSYDFITNLCEEVFGELVTVQKE